MESLQSDVTWWKYFEVDYKVYEHKKMNRYMGVIWIQKSPISLDTKEEII